MKANQLEEVKAHLKRYNHLTSLDAIKEYGITRLAHHIYILRNRGWDIITLPSVVTNRYGTKVNVAIYQLNN